MGDKPEYHKYGEDQKKITFAITDKQHADLRIRIHYDGLSQVKFFQAFLQGYLEGNQLILEYIDQYKEKNEIHSREKRRRTRKLNKDGEAKLSDFGFSAQEVQDIFDTIEGDQE